MSQLRKRREEEPEQKKPTSLPQLPDLTPPTAGDLLMALSDQLDYDEEEGRDECLCF